MGELTMKVCQKCGATSSDDSAFCGNCGYNFVSNPNNAYSQRTDTYSTNSCQNSSPHNNPLAVAALVLGIISIVFLCCKGFGGIPGVLAIIFGVVSRNSIRQSGGRETGMGFSRAGLVLGIISVSLVVVGIIIFAVVGVSAASLLSQLNLN
jgi:hypothetical protein